MRAGQCTYSIISLAHSGATEKSERHTKPQGRKVAVSLKVIQCLLLLFSNHKIFSHFDFISQGDISIEKILFQLVKVSTTVYLAVTFFRVN